MVSSFFVLSHPLPVLYQRKLQVLWRMEKAISPREVREEATGEVTIEIKFEDAVEILQIHKCLKSEKQKG